MPARLAWLYRYAGCSTTLAFSYGLTPAFAVYRDDTLRFHWRWTLLDNA